MSPYPYIYLVRECRLAWLIKIRLDHFISAFREFSKRGSVRWFKRTRPVLRFIRLRSRHLPTPTFSRITTLGIFCLYPLSFVNVSPMRQISLDPAPILPAETPPDPLD